MENILALNTKNIVTRDLDIDNKVDVDLNRSKNEFQNVIQNVISNGADYIIKAMPINNNIKDILVDVKKAFETKDFKTIVKTAVNSSIREGLEILSIPKNVIRDITKIKDIAFSGGLNEALSAGIDLVTKRFFNGNVFANYISNFVKQVKDFLFSKVFNTKVDQSVNKTINRGEKYKDLCENWYEAYAKFDIESINTIAKSLNEKKRGIMSMPECITQNNIIQNMTELINSKKDKLSQIQLQICNEM